MSVDGTLARADEAGPVYSANAGLAAQGSIPHRAIPSERFVLREAIALETERIKAVWHTFDCA